MKVSKLFLVAIASVLLIVPCKVKSQANVKDSALTVNMLYPTYAFSIPAGDMADRFGYSHQIGAGYMLKLKSGWSIAFEGNFIFRDGVKNASALLSNIMTPDGYIIDKTGVFANISISERGYDIWAKAGKLFPVGGSNPNSGILVQLGGGFLQHKIRIDVASNTAPQLAGDYKKGYDHMCNGPAMVQFIGYQHLSNSRKINFFAGLEFAEAFTKSRRAYYFNEMVRPSENRFDMLSSIKIGWYLPMYKKGSQKYYYY